ncbi:MAG: phosphatidylserine decarboxylase family protein, partial [Acidobacteria bacterium]
MTIAKEGYPYIITLFVISAALLFFRFYWIGGALLFLTLFIAFFFRDPERVFSGKGREVLSPADGKVVSIRKEDGKDVISIFLSVFDVHINRAPVAGKVTKVEYTRGKFLAAFDERASLENERNSISMDHDG